MPHRPKIVFLPGAGGSPEFWSEVADRLPASWPKTLLGWPGAGNQPHDPRVRSFEDLVEITQARITDRCDVVAQSMGGVVAVGLALRYPKKVRRLVLVATSGGLDVQACGAQDWRAEYRTRYPGAAAWITENSVDYTAHMARVTAPTLLLWGDQDPISPVPVGQRLTSLLPDSRLAILHGGTHDLAGEQPDTVAQAIADHLARPGA